jgi:putative endonuclease
VLAHLMFAYVKFGVRKGLAKAEPIGSSGDAHSENAVRLAKKAALRTGVRGETYAYWFLRRKGYILIARNYALPGFKGEIDIVGYDGDTLAFVEVKTRIIPQSVPHADRSKYRLPEQAVDAGKRRNLMRIARQFLRIRRIESVPHRFDTVAIESQPGIRPQVRLYKGAFLAETLTASPMA